MRFLLSILYLSVLFFLVPVALPGQHASAIFEYLSTDDGLAQNHVFNITRDKEGFMWFSTMGGLSKYDGFSFTNYYHREGDSTTLTSSYCNAFYQDRQGRCWVPTQNGFNQWDRKTGTSRRFYHDPKDDHSLGHNHTRAVIEDKDGNIWIVHQRGVDKFDPSTNRFYHFFNDHFSVARHSGAIAINQEGTIWVMGVNGLFKIDHQKDSLIFMKGLPPSLTIPPHQGRDLYIDSLDRIWMGYRNGFALYHPQTNGYEIFNEGPFAFGVMKILEYSPGVLAIATGRGGLVLWDISSRTVLSHFSHSPLDEYSIRGPSIYCMYIDPVENIWLGLFYGISVTNLETKRFKFIRHTTGFANYANFILRLYKDPLGGIWSNTMTGLYYQRDIHTPGKEFIQSSVFPEGYKSITGISGDADGNVFFAWREVGLFQYTYGTGRIRQMDIGHQLDMADLVILHNDVVDENVLWIGTSKGLCRWDKTNSDTIWYRTKSLYPSLHTDAVSRVTQDASGNLYFINSGKLCRLGKMNSVLDTLPSAFRIKGTIQGLDISGNDLWIGSREGVYKYDLIKNQCHKITTPNGTQIRSEGLVVDAHGTAWSIAHKVVTRISNDDISYFQSPTDFVFGIGARAADGQLFFGGEDGYIAIQPDSFYTDTVSPVIVFCGIDVANQSRTLTQEAEYTTKIDLEYTDKVFTLHYAALHFNHRKGILYYYQLDGFDEAWIDAGPHRSATYTNLPHGKYTFRAKAITEDGRESIHPLQIEIAIHPPFYKTTWFYALVLLLMGALFYFMYSLRQKTIRLKKEKVFAEQQAAYKSMFLANMSHEIRTPLHAITGLNNLLLQTPLNERQEEYAKAINASCDNLLWIVNDILDQSKIESGTYAIESKPFDLGAILHQLEILFRHIALEKGLQLTFFFEGTMPALLIGDPVRLIQILSNLLNNAIKFTDKGSITVLTQIRIHDDEQHADCTFKITDTGIGIPANKVSAIFESFQQVNEKILAGNQGTGLGLSIVKYLVGKMDGIVHLHSAHGSGSEFTVTLPFLIRMDHKTIDAQRLRYTKLKPGLRILLVEDAPLNQLVAAELIKKWMTDPIIEIAENGKEALEKVQQGKYDLVLMDVKMPIMDGLESTRKIRSLEDPYYKSLPIAGLTANVIPQQVDECLKAGMNTFIAKPIQKEEFLQKLSTIIAS